MRKKLLAIVAAMAVALTMIPSMAFAANTDVAVKEVTGVSVVDGVDGWTKVKNPAVGQKLTANIQTTDGVVGSYPVNEDAEYFWHYEGSDAVLGTGAVYTVTEDNLGKVLCVDVKINGYKGEATWSGKVGTVKVTGVSVVDGTDGYTPVTKPVVGQKLTANIQTTDGVVGSYPVNEDAEYFWHYEGSDAVLGTGAVYTVTEDNLGKVLCVDVKINGYEGSASWTAEDAVVAFVDPEEPTDPTDPTDPVDPVKPADPAEKTEATDEAVQTGDSVNLMIPAAVAFAALLGLGGVFVTRRRHN